MSRAARIRELEIQTQDLEASLALERSKRFSPGGAVGPPTHDDLLQDVASQARILRRGLMETETRHCILAVSLMLKNRYDAMPVDEGAHVEAVQAGYDRVRKLRAILGPVSEAEIEAATALWEETAS